MRNTVARFAPIPLCQSVGQGLAMGRNRFFASHTARDKRKLKSKIKIQRLDKATCYFDDYCSFYIKEDDFLLKKQTLIVMQLKLVQLQQISFYSKKIESCHLARICTETITVMQMYHMRDTIMPF